MISLRNMTYFYPGEELPALKNINLDVGENEFLVILGRNGSGKSTLARLLNGLLLPIQGKVEVDGWNTADADKLQLIRQRVGLLFSNPDNQLISNQVEEDVAFGPENLGLKRSEIRQRVSDSLQQVSMEAYRKAAPAFLSGGQKQKVAIAGVMAMKPRYLVLDEALSMIDPRGKSEIIESIRCLHKNKGVSLIMITHDLEEARGADRVVVLGEGEVKAISTPGELFPLRRLLLALGLEPLEISNIIEEINSRGISFGRNILEMDKLVEEICRFI
ncbi:MAG: energy-coupling factor transporter ATPase [Syntrophomonas sp.]|uniref:energy-coupling factor transporter ATPase n=1 Tax=Syntrophomonas sp. TaxID=2053627 RepID=UPI00263738B8|nr:energy-coupling factor transporter ATPase [Syntrophomonas sp.]MDD3879765.1 energy-coupling factor transporter ATPase [Syntrophomonas sp.]MDD4626270.1 energy-coupling factor transporter ATPase [Syntrophomonas sp.]